MHDTLRMCVAHCVAHMREDGDEPAQPVGRRLPLLEQLAQRVALDELHGQERLAVGERANFVGGRNAGVLQLSGDGGLDAEAHGGGRIGERVACAANHAHAACADLFGQFISARQQLSLSCEKLGTFVPALGRKRYRPKPRHGPPEAEQNALYRAGGDDNTHVFSLVPSQVPGGRGGRDRPALRPTPSTKGGSEPSLARVPRQQPGSER